MKPSRNKLKKVATIIGAAPRHGSAIKAGLRQIYDDIVLSDSPIRIQSLLEFPGE